MSEFNQYARRADEIAKAAFKEYRAAESRLAKAEAAAKEYPQRHGMVDAAYMTKSARAQADLLEAQEGMKAAKRAFEGHIKDFQEIRKELAAELEDAYSADPAALDAATLELLKSGILNAGEYARLLHGAQAANNPTMARIIGKYAQDAADAQGAKHGQGDATVRALRAVSYESRQGSGGEQLQAFDIMADVYSRAVSNPGMIDHWDELTAETVENF